jgi:hypothetical protein
MNAGKKPNSVSLGEVTGAGALAVGLVTAWLYLAGWTYAYHYFDYFGIPLLMVDIPKENYFVYGGIVFMEFSMWVLAIGIIVLFGAALWRWLRLDVGSLKYPLTTFVLLGVFWLAHQSAVMAARRQYVQQRVTDFSSYPRVQFQLKDTEKNQEDSFSATGDAIAGCFRLVLHNRDRLFLIRPVRGAMAAELPVLIVTWDKVQYLRVLPDYTSCG